MTSSERHTVWTPAEESLLVTAFHAGIAPERMADALRKTPGSVRWKLNAFGLLPGNPDATGPTSETDTLDDYRARKGDLAFKRAMLKAIASGAEKSVPSIVRAKPGARYIPCVRAPSDSGYRSSAALAADLGERESPREDAQRAGTSDHPGLSKPNRVPRCVGRNRTSQSQRAGLPVDRQANNALPKR
jgi:hypothetical protein